MREGCESGGGEAGEEHAGGDADRFLYVVVLDFSLTAVWIGDEAVELGEDDDDVGGLFDVRLVPVGS